MEKKRRGPGHRPDFTQCFFPLSTQFIIDFSAISLNPPLSHFSLLSYLKKRNVPIWALFLSVVSVIGFNWGQSRTVGSVLIVFGTSSNSRKPASSIPPHLLFYLFVPGFWSNAPLGVSFPMHQVAAGQFRQICQLVNCLGRPKWEA